MDNMNLMELLVMPDAINETLTTAEALEIEKQLETSDLSSGQKRELMDKLDKQIAENMNNFSSQMREAVNQQAFSIKYGLDFVLLKYRLVKNSDKMDEYEREVLKYEKIMKENGSLLFEKPLNTYRVDDILGKSGFIITQKSFLILSGDMVTKVIPLEKISKFMVEKGFFDVKITLLTKEYEMYEIKHEIPKKVAEDAMDLVMRMINYILEHDV